MDGGRSVVSFASAIHLVCAYVVISSWRSQFTLKHSQTSFTIHTSGLQRDIFSHKITTSEAWPYYPGEIPTRPDCLDDPWHKHATEPNTCTNIGDYNPPTQFPTKAPTPLPTVSPSESPTLLPTPEDKFLKVFITSETYQGNLGGVAGADLKCQTLAINANLTGTFKAWLSDSSGNHPDTTYLKAGTPYYLMDGATIIANSYQDLISGNIVHAIEVNELGEIVQVNENSTDIVWTSTDGAGGSYAPNYCANFEGTEWESNSFEDYGGAGQFNNGIPGAWSYVGNSTCDMFHRLYCFEQNVSLLQFAWCMLSSFLSILTYILLLLILSML